MTHQELKSYLRDHFALAELKAPLFYHTAIGLRFELGPTGYPTSNQEYFAQVVLRASELFKATFRPTENILVVYQIGCSKRQRIRRYNSCFQHVQGLQSKQISYRTVKNLYDARYFYSAWKRAIINTRVDSVHYPAIFAGLAHQDFPSSRAVIDAEVYFISKERPLIFHMYDDRGLDIVAKDLPDLQAVYEQFHDWLLAYDLEKIDTTFRK